MGTDLTSRVAELRRGNPKITLMDMARSLDQSPDAIRDVMAALGLRVSIHRAGRPKVKNGPAPIFSEFWGRMALSPQTTGAIAELRVASDLMARGFDVYRALSPHSAADLVAANEEITLRIEVRCSKWTKRAQAPKRKHDHLATVNPDGQIYYYPTLPEEKGADHE